MNYIIISPYFPQNFQNFAHRLAAHGVTVLGIGEEPYDILGADLQGSLTEYYRVQDLNDWEEVKRAVAHLFYKHGPIDRIESHNEHWMELDAALREQFNVPGIQPKDLLSTKLKSEMKKRFRRVGVPVTPGYRIDKEKDLTAAIKAEGFPLIAKPDTGVGAAGTYRLDSQKDVKKFLEEWDHQEPYFVEPFVTSKRIVTYDGLLDRDGNVVFETSYELNIPPFEIATSGKDLYFTVTKEVDPLLSEYGQKALKEFGMKERFFHLEFFKEDDDYLALEYNNRPSGGYSIDTYNYAHSIDLFDQYARIVMGNDFQVSPFEPEYAIYIARYDGVDYAHSHEEILHQFGDNVKIFARVPEAFAPMMGNDFYIINTDLEDNIEKVADFVQERK